MNNNNTIKLALFATVFLLVIILGIFGISKIKVDDFKKAAIIFVLDASASNQKNLTEQKLALRQFCSMLDPEDHIKILRVSEDAYIIYEGTPQAGSEIRKVLDKFTQYDPKEFGTAYGQGLTKSFTYLQGLTKEGYTPGIVVIGDLENEGHVSKQINWNTLSNDVAKMKKMNDNFSMMFLHAAPKKLDTIKEKLFPILGEEHLVIGNEVTTGKTSRKFLHAIGR